jgi:regulation of enolase protein 1 (concanavalin A-like superfamily)
MNLLDGLTQETLAAHGFAWEHLLRWAPLPGGGIRVAVPAVTDYFRDPAGEKTKDNGPYLWRDVTGDFVARLHVRPTFAGRYDAGGILVRQDEERWAKLCFESTNFGTTAAISVVTRGLSDDANGVDLTALDVWLQICRAGDVVGMQYALDGSTCHFPARCESACSRSRRETQGPRWISCGSPSRRARWRTRGRACESAGQVRSGGPEGAADATTFDCMAAPKFGG